MVREQLPAPSERTCSRESEPCSSCGWVSARFPAGWRPSRTWDCELQDRPHRDPDELIECRHLRGGAEAVGQAQAVDEGVLMRPGLIQTPRLRGGRQAAKSSID